MVDGALLAIELLASHGLAAFGPILPDGHDPGAATALTIACVGGTTDPENLTIQEARIQLRGWAGVDQQQKARAAYNAAATVLHGAQGVALVAGYVLECLEIVAGQDITDPDTGWATVLGFFKLTARPNFS